MCTGWVSVVGSGRASNSTEHAISCMYLILLTDAPVLYQLTHRSLMQCFEKSVVLSDEPNIQLLVQ